jgi:hypothetical protein
MYPLHFHGKSRVRYPSIPVIESGNKLTEIMAHNLKEQQSAGHHPVIPAVDHTPQFSDARCHYA